VLGTGVEGAGEGRKRRKKKGKADARERSRNKRNMDRNKSLPLSSEDSQSLDKVLPKANTFARSASGPGELAS
jgi:ribosomal protein S8E